jgi:phage-related protein
MKPVRFLENSRETIRDFGEASHEAGHQILQVQLGRDPDDWKPMKTIGPSVREIRFQEDKTQHRVVYVAKFEEAVYIIHAFTKKSQKTPPKDLNVAKARYKQLLSDRQKEKRERKKP